jgi:imidazolonepropionase-like amidohydrolase
MKQVLTAIAVSMLFVLAGIGTASAQDSKANATLFQNVNIFDGKSDKLIQGMSVLVDGNKIAKIAKSIPAPAGATVIDAKGRTLMPGMIDAHWHSLFATISQAKLLQSDVAYINLHAAQANHDALLRGFTAVRDVGGNVFGLKKATDEGLLVGPRIYPSGAYISQTSGHGDFRGPLDVPTNPATPLDYLQRTGNTLIADGAPEVI